MKVQMSTQNYPQQNFEAGWHKGTRVEQFTYMDDFLDTIEKRVNSGNSRPSIMDIIDGCKKMCQECMRRFDKNNTFITKKEQSDIAVDILNAKEGEKEKIIDKIFNMVNSAEEY